MIAVCGAGAAGMAAAIASARAGLSVELIEARGDVGGTVADVLLHTLAGLYDSRGEELNPGLPRELIARLGAADLRVRKRRMGKLWVLEVDPNVYRSVTRAWLASEPRIRLHTAKRVAALETQGKRVVGLELTRAPGLEPDLLHRADESPLKLPVEAVVDATGDAALLRALDPALVQPDERPRAGGWVLRMRGVRRGTLEFPRNLGVVRAVRDAALSGALPPLCHHAFVDTGPLEDEIFIKLLVPLPPNWRPREAELSRAVAHAGRALARFLRALEGFSRAKVTEHGSIGVRDGGRALGEYVLTEADVLGCRAFTDAVCRVAWPIEYWDAQRGAELVYLPDGAFYEIPERALKVRALENVWVAGKCLSADARAQASARTVGTCWATGERAGLAAAKSVRRTPQGAPCAST